MALKSQLTNTVRSRPKSAHPFHSSHLRQHRIDDNQSLNSIRNHIHKVFSHQNKPMKEVKQLTSTLKPAYSQRIDRMCIQYSICTNPKRQKRLSEDIDVEFIAKKYIKAKSRDKKKEEQRVELRRSIGATSRRYDPIQPDQFFNFNHESLRKMQKKALKANNNRSLRQHPYMAIYQRVQDEALVNLTDRNSLVLKQLSDHPIMAQPDEWQRETKQIKSILSGVRNLRSGAMRYRERRRGDEEGGSFYIT